MVGSTQIIKTLHPLLNKQNFSGSSMVKRKSIRGAHHIFLLSGGLPEKGLGRKSELTCTRKDSPYNRKIRRHKCKKVAYSEFQVK